MSFKIGISGRAFCWNKKIWQSIVFCCVVACIQPDFFGCQQDFLVVWRWNQLRTCLGIFENNFTDFREAVSLEKIFEIVQENTLKCSKLISFLGNKKSSLNQCQAWSCYYATGCFVEFFGDFPHFRFFQLPFFSIFLISQPYWWTLLVTLIGEP